MNEIQKKSRRNKQAERVSLANDIVRYVDGLLEQVRSKFPDLKLTRSDIVNWALKRRGSKLSDRELLSIEKEFFDPVKALEDAIRLAKRKKLDGQDIDLEALVAEKLLFKRKRGPKKENKRSERSEVAASASTATLD